MELSAREAKNNQGSRQDRDDGHLDFLLLDLLAHVFRRAPDHQPADEDGDDRIDQHAVEAGADASEDHLVGLDVEQRNQPAERREAVVHAVDGAATGVGGHGGEQRRLAMPKRTSLPSMLPPGWLPV